MTDDGYSEMAKVAEGQAPAQAAAKTRAADPIDTRTVRKLADILRETDLTSIEVERGELRIRVARETAVAAAPVYAAAPAPSAPAAPSSASSVAPVSEPALAVPARRDSDLVKSPMVGTVYLQAQPGAAPFAKVGDKVTAGQTLLIIEAMKTMNPVAATKDGTVVELMVGDGQPVEFGQPLAVVT